jgi:hypothetical protein
MLGARRRARISSGRCSSSTARPATRSAVLFERFQLQRGAAAQRELRPGPRQLSVGNGVIDFTDLSNPREIAWSDPPPLPFVPEIEIAPGAFIPNPFCGGVGCEIGGA